MFEGEQAENLERVTARIGRSVVGFCERVYDSTLKTFHADGLRQTVIHETGTAAPASADRVLRNLRQKGALNYRVLSRKESLYEVLSIRNREKKNGSGSQN